MCQSIYYHFWDTARYLWKKSSFYHTPLHSTTPLRGFPSEYRHPLWDGRTRMVSLSDGEKNFEDNFIIFDVIHERDGQTDGQTLRDSKDRACIASRGKNRRILMKFGTLHQILNPVTVTWPKLIFWKFNMAAAAILKIAYLAITHRPIVRFHRNFVWGSRTAGWQGLHDKNCKFLKSKMADDAILKIVKSPYLSEKSSDFDEIRCTIEMLNPIAVTWPKIEIFWIQDGGDRHLQNR